jgi:Flp pilus assembly protein TadD
MRTELKRLSAVCASTLLLACSAPAASDGAGRPAGAADALYAQGRAQYAAQRTEQAAASFRQALAIAPGHPNARNGLAAIAAQRGELAQAIAQWRTLTREAAAASGADAAFLYGNLGYAYFLDGRYADALAALERACLLDPLDEVAWKNLGIVLDKLGQRERAQRMLAQAAALRAHDLQADLALAGRAGDAAAPAARQTEQTAQWAGARVRLGDDGIVDLERLPAPAARKVAATRLEIRNGNGVTGMAGALGRAIASPTVSVVLLSNEKGFGVARTRVEFAPSMRAQASVLAARFKHPLLREVDNCKHADVRVVIGRDLIGANGRPILGARLAARAAPGSAG